MLGGAVLSHKLRSVVNCHCAEYRKFHGIYAAYTRVNTADIHLFDANLLKWYQQCGASLFWQKDSSTMRCHRALTVPTHLNTPKHLC